MKLAHVALLIAFGLTSCFKDESGQNDSESMEAGKSSTKSEYKRIRDEVIALKKEKRSLEDRIKAIEGAGEDQPSLVEKEIQTAEKLAQIRGYRSAIDRHEAALDQSLDQWRTATRASFAGVKLPGIKTIKGEQYTGVTIKQINDESMTFDHSGGSATVPILELPLGLRKNVIHEATVLAGRSGN